MPFKCFLRMRMEGKYRDGYANKRSMSREKSRTSFLWTRQDGKKCCGLINQPCIIHSRVIAFVP
ncbi:hypothetical protein N7491_011380 [Penicillium cf. griseofulvum]|nr:hypothetical protein N7491_011380 [Penicillium cf. griseofulvum]